MEENLLPSESHEVWLNEMVSGYKKNPVHALKTLLELTIMASNQFLEDPKSHATRDILESLNSNTKMFFEKIENL